MAAIQAATISEAMESWHPPNSGIHFSRIFHNKDFFFYLASYSGVMAGPRILPSHHKARFFRANERMRNSREVK